MTTPKLFGLAAIAVSAALTLSACAAPMPDPAPAPPAATNAGADVLLAEFALEGLAATELVDHLDQLAKADRPAGLSSSITGDHVILIDEHEHRVEVPLPDDLVYVSAAPYLTQTHDCFAHSPTGCIGEQQNVDVQVSVVDADGVVILDEQRRTFDNGFVGMWLPRGIEATLTLTVDGKSATAPISTAGDNVQTCITTMQLS